MMEPQDVKALKAIRDPLASLVLWVIRVLKEELVVTVPWVLRYVE